MNIKNQFGTFTIIFKNKNLQLYLNGRHLGTCTLNKLIVTLDGTNKAIRITLEESKLISSLEMIDKLHGKALKINREINKSKAVLSTIKTIKVSYIVVKTVIKTVFVTKTISNTAFNTNTHLKNKKVLLPKNIFGINSKKEFYNTC